MISHSDREQSPSSPLQSILSRCSASTGPIVAAEVRLLRLPTRETLVASHGSHGAENNPKIQGGPNEVAVRDLTVVRLSSNDTPLSGWGECAALPTPDYWPETAMGSFDALGRIAGRLIGHSPLELLDLIRADGVEQKGLEGRPMAQAALEMAIVDLVLSSAGVSLAQALGADTKPIPAGATIGLAPTATVSDRAAELVNEGFARIKLKIEPKHDLAVVDAVLKQIDSTGHDGRVALQVDANGSYPPTEQAHQTFLGLAQLGVDVIEQPYPPELTEPAVALCQALTAQGLPTIVLADEAAATVDDAVAVLARGAAHGVVIKPSRLGGIGPALRLLDRAATADLVVSIGGMLESGLGRHALAAVDAVARQTATTLTGDLSPARRWLADDPWPDIVRTEASDRAEIVVPQSAGVAPEPDMERLDRYTIKRWGQTVGPNVGRMTTD